MQETAQHHYLDNAATSWPKPEQVYEAVNDFMRHVGASPGRSDHCLARQADQAVEETRELLADFFGATSPQLVAFTYNCTDGLNLVIKGLLKPGDHVVTSTMEHNSVSRPLRALERQGIDVTYLQPDEHWLLQAADLENVMRPGTKLVIMTHASNVIGAVQDITSLAKAAHKHGALFALDAAQTAGVIPIDMQTMGIDILVVPGHKGLLGPYATGAVITLRDEDISPWREGGTGIKSDARLHPLEMPYRLEGGTLNAAGIAGLRAGVDFIRHTGIDVVRKREQQHVQRLLDTLLSEPRVTVYGPRSADSRAGLVAFNIQGYTSAEVGQRMNDEFAVAGRSGLQCAPLAHRTIHTFPLGAFRLSPGFFTTKHDIDVAIKAIETLCRN